MRLSVIIVNWNVREYLKKCLSSIYTHTKDLPFEVYVVDNHSSDGSKDMVARDFPRVRLIESGANLGFAAANNLALKECRADYILFLNPDTELIDNSLKAMVAYMDGHPEAGSIGCKLLNPDRALQPSCRNFPSLFTDLMEHLNLDWIFPRSTFFNHYRIGLWKHDCLREVDVPAGACLLVKQEILKVIGLFDTRFFMYYDEIDLCYRIKKSGGKIFFVPHIAIIHHSNQSSNQIQLKAARWKYKSKLLFFDKHYGALSISCLFIFCAVGSFIAWGIFPITHLLFRMPRDNNYIQNVLKIEWEEYLKFLKPGRPRK